MIIKGYKFLLEYCQNDNVATGVKTKKQWQTKFVKAVVSIDCVFKRRTSGNENVRSVTALRQKRAFKSSRNPRDGERDGKVREGENERCELGIY